MKRLFYLIIINLIFFQGNSQRVVNNILFKDIDDLDSYDTLVSKNKMYITESYLCIGGQKPNDSCILFSTMKYNNAGRLEMLIKGSNLSENKVDYLVRYRKIADTLFETVTRYPLNSAMIPEEIFIDTLVKSKRYKICLYKKDEERNVFIRSLYNVNKKNGEIVEIKRFDIDGNLVQIFYPSGNRKPKKEWTETVISEYTKTIFYNAIYEENEYKTINVYNKKDQLIESSYCNSTFESGFYVITNQLIIYDNKNNPIIKTTVNENNQLLSEERYYYSNKILIRYSKDDDVMNESLNEERLYDSTGRIIYVEIHPLYSSNITVWKYYYNDKGFRNRDEYYLNGVLQNSRKYIYK